MGWGWVQILFKKQSGNAWVSTQSSVLFLQKGPPKSTPAENSPWAHVSLTLYSSCQSIPQTMPKLYNSNFVYNLVFLFQLHSTLISLSTHKPGRQSMDKPPFAWIFINEFPKPNQKLLLKFDLDLSLFFPILDTHIHPFSFQYITRKVDNRYITICNRHQWIAKIMPKKQVIQVLITKLLCIFIEATLWAIITLSPWQSLINLRTACWGNLSLW